MFIRLTELIPNPTRIGGVKERPISVNPDKVQSFYADGNKENSIIELRRSSIKVKESYDTIWNLINTS